MCIRDRVDTAEDRRHHGQGHGDQRHGKATQDERGQAEFAVRRPPFDRSQQLDQRMVLKDGQRPNEQQPADEEQQHNQQNRGNEKPPSSQGVLNETTIVHTTINFRFRLSL